MHWGVVHTLLRVDLTHWRMGPTPHAAFVEASLHRSCCVLSFFLLFCVTLCNFLWHFVCVVDIFYFSFWFLFGNLFSTITFHLNLYGFLGSLFKCLIGVFVLPINLSITSMRRGKRFLRLHLHLSFSFMISFLFFEICPVGVLVSLSLFIYFLLCYLCNIFV
jgi:hypothetical protein